MLMGWTFDKSRIKALRDGKNLNPTQFGKRIGASGQQVSQWESGEVVPGAEIIAKMSTAYEMFPGYFFVDD